MFKLSTGEICKRQRQERKANMIQKKSGNPGGWREKDTESEMDYVHGDLMRGGG